MEVESKRREDKKKIFHMKIVVYVSLILIYVVVVEFVFVCVLSGS